MTVCDSTLMLELRNNNYQVSNVRYNNTYQDNIVDSIESMHILVWQIGTTKRVDYVYKSNKLSV